MRSICLVSVFASLLFASFAHGQNQPRGPQPPPPAKAGPYKAVSVTPPQAISDAAFEAFRKQMNEAAQRKDRGALAKLVVGQGFFWLRENGDRADTGFFQKEEDSHIGTGINCLEQILRGKVFILQSGHG